MATVPIDEIADDAQRKVSKSNFLYPGIPTTCDGAEAVVWVETRISQGCGRLSDHQLHHHG